MEKAKKIITNVALAVILLVSVFLLLFPYFTSEFLDVRQEQEDAENEARRIREELARIEAERKSQEEAEMKIYLTGKFDPATREDFISVAPQYALSANKIYLRKETYEAYLQMRSAAESAGVDLKVASATRNFDYQKKLWNNKWTGVTLVDGKNLSQSIPNELDRFKKILEYSAAPGTSRHHWGTDIDINGADPAYFNSPKGAREYAWLAENAYKFGFCQTYNFKTSTRSVGYNEEKWHWSYLPLARNFTEQYKNIVKDGDIKGFLGDAQIPALNLINDYVLAINPDCI